MHSTKYSDWDSGLINFIWSITSIKSLLIGIAVAFFVHWLIQKRKYRLPPGPFSLPLIGVIGNYEFYIEKYPHRQFFEMSKKYGPVLRVNFGPSKIIVLNNIDVVLEALVKRGADFADRPGAVSFDVFTEGGKDIALGKYGPTWKLHRKIAGKALRYYLAGENLEKTAQQACTKVIKLMREEKGPFDPAKYCNLLVFNVVCAVCYGKIYDLNDEEFVKIMEIADARFKKFSSGVLEDIVPFLKDIWPTKRFREIVDLANELLDILRQKYQEHFDTFDKKNIRDFTDSLILAKTEAEDEADKEILASLTDTHLIQTLSDIFFGGIDTSRFTINWAILHMAGLQDIQAKCHKEIDNVVGGNRLPSLKDREQLCYTEAVLHESMRLNMASPLSLPHRTRCDTHVGGFDIPKGTTVLMNLWALHHDPKHWKDVDKFDPDRYLDPYGKLDVKPDSWLPFSAGRRVCLAESVAKPLLCLVFTNLLQAFKIKLPPGETTKFEESDKHAGAIPASYKIVVEERYRE